MNPTSILSASNLDGFYGKSRIIQELSFSVNHGELVALLGRNGVGKTTTMRALAGILDRASGEVLLNGVPILGKPPHVIARMGLSLVPEDRAIFASLSVEENLMMARRPGPTFTVERIWSMFPSLASRRRTPGGKLSGGEQQMLSIGRALMTHPKMLLLDEPTEGLAPVIVDRLVEIIQELKAAGLSILLVEQNFEVCMAIADRSIVLEGGRIVWSGDRAGLVSDADLIKSRYLSLEHA